MSAHNGGANTCQRMIIPQSAAGGYHTCFDGSPHAWNGSLGIDTHTQSATYNQLIMSEHLSDSRAAFEGLCQSLRGLEWVLCSTLKSETE